MSDNIINSDSKEPLRNEIPPNQGNEETNKQVSKDEKSQDKPDIPEKTGSDTGVDDLDKDEKELSEKANIDEEKKVLNTGDDDEKITGEVKPRIPDPPVKSKPKESNYQISLIDENLLKVVVTTKKGVKIFSSVKENRTLSETQNSEICFNPVFDYSLQEIEVLISIEEEIPSKETDNIVLSSADEGTADIGTDNEKSNYQINLINENLLKIKILTSNGVRIDSAGRDKRNQSPTQSNKIYLKQKKDDDPQDIEITIEIDEEIKDLKAVTDDGKIRFIPNPEVVDLIKPPDYSALLSDDPSYREEGSSYKNPFDALRKLIRRNLTIGLIAAVVLHLAAVGFAFVSLSKKSKDQVPEEPSRLIVLQDLPDPKIKLEDVEDPNKPKVEPPLVTEEQEKIMREPKREIVPRDVVKPPVVKRPRRDEEETKLDSTMESNLQRDLDSLRQLREKELADSLLGSTDSTKSDSLSSAYVIPDSLRNDFNENDIGLAMYFPKNWKLTDQREINKNEKEFKGVVLTDTTAEQPGTMTMFIFIDNENKDYNAEDFKTEFVMTDSNLTAFLKEPKTLAGFTEYRFYIFNKLGTEKLSLRASVRKQFFDQYKNEVEAVVRSIRIKKKEDLDSLSQ